MSQKMFIADLIIMGIALVGCLVCFTSEINRGVDDNGINVRMRDILIIILLGILIGITIGWVIFS